MAEQEVVEDQAKLDDMSLDELDKASRGQEPTPKPDEGLEKPPTPQPTAEERIAQLEQRLKSEIGRAQSLDKQYQDRLKNELAALEQKLKAPEKKPEEVSAEIQELQKFITENALKAVQEKYKDILADAESGRTERQEAIREQKFWQDAYRLAGPNYAGEKFKDIQTALNEVCAVALKKNEEAPSEEAEDHIRQLVENPAYAMLHIREHLSNNVKQKANEHNAKLDAAANKAATVLKGGGQPISGKKALKDMSQAELDELDPNDPRWKELPGSR